MTEYKKLTPQEASEREGRGRRTREGLAEWDAAEAARRQINFSRISLWKRTGFNLEELVSRFADIDQRARHPLASKATRDLRTALERHIVAVKQEQLKAEV